MMGRRRRRGPARAALLLLGLSGLAVTTGWVLTPSSSSSGSSGKPPLTTCAAAATFRNTGSSSSSSGSEAASESKAGGPSSSGSKAKPVEPINRQPNAIQGGGKPRPMYKKKASSPPQPQHHQHVSNHGAINAARAHQHQQQHHHHPHPAAAHHHPPQQQHIPFLPYTRLHGSDCKALLNSIETHAEDAKIEELTDALSRLGRLAPSNEALGRISQDARFHLLLERLADNSHLMPPKWAPFVLSSLTKFSAASPSTAATALLSSPAMRSLLQVLQQRVDVGLPHLSPIALCTVAFAFSRLRYAPHLDEGDEAAAAAAAVAAAHVDPPAPHLSHATKKSWKYNHKDKDNTAVLAWWSLFIETSQDRLIEFSPWELSQLIRSLMGQVDAPKEALLTPPFLTLALKCAERQLFTTFTARDLEGLATSLSKLPPHLYKPSPRFLETLVKAADAHLPTGFRPPTLARLLHALSRLEGFNPDPAFLLRAEQACAASASKWDQGSIALVSQAWSWMKFQPSENTLSALLAQAKGMLLDGSFTPLNAGTLIQSLGELRRCPDEGWLCAFREAAFPKLGQMQGKDLNFILKGLAKLNWYPGDAFLAALLQHMLSHLEQFNGSDLQFTLSSLVGLHFLPPPIFVSAFQRRFSVLLRQGYVSPRDLSIVLWSFAALEIPDSRFFLVECMQAAVKQLEGERGRWEGLEKGGTERWALTARVRQLRQVYLYAESVEAGRREGGREGLAEEFRRMGLVDLLEEGLRHANDEMVLAKAQESGFHREVAEVLHSLGATTRRSVDCFVLDLLIEPREGGRVEEGMEEGGESRMMTTMMAAGEETAVVGGEREQGLSAATAPVELVMAAHAAHLPTITNCAAAPAPPAPAPAVAAPPTATEAAEEDSTSQNKPLVLLLHGPSRFLRGQTGANSPKLEAGTAFKEKILQTQTPQRFTRVASLDVWEWARQKTREAKVELLRAKIGRGLLESYLMKQPAVTTASAAGVGGGGGGGGSTGVVA